MLLTSSYGSWWSEGDANEGDEDEVEVELDSLEERSRNFFSEDFKIDFFFIGIISFVAINNEVSAAIERIGGVKFVVRNSDIICLILFD